MARLRKVPWASPGAGLTLVGMWRGDPVPIALTIDDAPSVSEPGGPELDVGRMDRVREALLAAGIRHCVAFVIGERARGHEACLRRWLEAGFELGNHTQDHVAASAVDPERFARSVRACDELLLDVGAFEGGRRRYFRHPYGDRGRAGVSRRAIAATLGELGYVPAEATLDLYDYLYDPAWARAGGSQPERAAQIETRWVNAAAHSVRRSSARGRRIWGPELIHVAVCHFGPVVDRRIAELVRTLEHEARWTSLAEASSVPSYQALITDLAREGMPADLLCRGWVERAIRRAARLAGRMGARGRSAALGPRWPHLGL